MIIFKSNPQNDEYLMLDIFGIACLARDEDLCIPPEVLNEARIIFSVYACERYQKNDINEFNIRKDSVIGEYLINNFDQDYIINEDEYILCSNYRSIKNFYI